jgi:GNAT superfamily N-acetyltransferase
LPDYDKEFADLVPKKSENYDKEFSDLVPKSKSVAPRHGIGNLRMTEAEGFKPFRVDGPVPLTGDIGPGVTGRNPLRTSVQMDPGLLQRAAMGDASAAQQIQRLMAQKAPVNNPVRTAQRAQPSTPNQTGGFLNRSLTDVSKATGVRPSVNPVRQAIGNDPMLRMGQALQGRDPIGFVGGLGDLIKGIFQGGADSTQEAAQQVSAPAARYAEKNFPTGMLLRPDLAKDLDKMGYVGKGWKATIQNLDPSQIPAFVEAVTKQADASGKPGVAQMGQELKGMFQKIAEGDEDAATNLMGMWNAFALGAAFEGVRPPALAMFKKVPKPVDTIAKPVVAADKVLAKGIKLGDMNEARQAADEFVPTTPKTTYRKPVQSAQTSTPKTTPQDVEALSTDVKGGKKEPWEMTREEFVGNPRLYSGKTNVKETPKRVYAATSSATPEPFLGGKFQIRRGGSQVAVYDGEKVIATYTGGDNLVVDPKYRRQGIATELLTYYKRNVDPTQTAASRSKEVHGIYNKVHKSEVETALKEGKPVPASVLDDYPDLAAKYGKPKQQLVSEPEVKTGEAKTVVETSNQKGTGVSESQVPGASGTSGAVKTVKMYHGGPAGLTELKLGGKMGQDSGGIFFTPNKDYAKQYSKGGLYEADIPMDEIFDAKNPAHVKRLKDGFLARVGDEYDGYEDAASALKDYEHVKNLDLEDWATGSQYSDIMEAAGFKGARFKERPGNIDVDGSGGFTVSGDQIDSIALFRGPISVRNADDLAHAPKPPKTDPSVEKPQTKTGVSQKPKTQPKNPDTEEPKATGDVEPSGISHAEVDKLREQGVIGGERQGNVKPDSDLFKEAKKHEGKEDALATKVLDGDDTLDDAQHVALGNKLNSLIDEMNDAVKKGDGDAFDTANAQATRIANALDESGSRQGRAFRARQFLFEREADPWIVRRKMENAGHTEADIQKALKDVEDLRTEVRKVAPDWDESKETASQALKRMMDAAQEEAKARAALDVISGKSGGKKGSVSTKAQREAKAQEIKDLLKKTFREATTIQSGGLQSLFENAPDLVKAIREYIELFIKEKQIAKLEDLYEPIRKELKEMLGDDVPENLDITDSDIRATLARFYETVTKDRGQSAKQLSELRKQASLIENIERIREGIAPIKGRSPAGASARVKALRSELNKLLKGTGDAPSERAVKTRLENILDKLKQDAASGARPNPVEREKLFEGIREEIANVRKDMRIEDRMGELESQLRDGPFVKKDARVEKLTTEPPHNLRQAHQRGVHDQGAAYRQVPVYGFDGSQVVEPRRQSG